MKGKNATQYAENGKFDNAAITVWNRGSNADVIWKTQAKHRGEGSRMFISILWGSNLVS